MQNSTKELEIYQKLKPLENQIFTTKTGLFDALVSAAICTGRRPLRHSPSGRHARSERPPNQMADLGLITTV